MNRQLGLFPKLVIACGVLLLALVYAGVDTAWVRRYDGPAHGEDWATRIAVDSAGNVYVTGTSMSDTGSNSQYLDFVTIKYYPNGDTAWVRRQEFGGKDIPDGLGVDAQGNIYVAGTNNDDKIATVKYSPSGALLWSKLFGSQGGASDLAIDSRGNVIVCGSSYRASADAVTIKYRPNGDTAWVRYYDYEGSDDWADAVAIGKSDDITVTGEGATATTHIDCITVRYDSTGSQLWAAGYDGPNHGVDVANDVAVDDSGDAIITGFGDDGYGTSCDYLTIKYHSSGETLWTRRYDGPLHGDDKATAVAVERDGSTIVTGWSHGLTTNEDYATVKYDTAGTQMWVARYDGPGHDYDQAYALAVDAQGNAYVTGGAWVNQADGGDVATIKYTSNGESLWCALYNGPGNWADQGNAVSVDSDGAVYVAGQSYGSSGFNTDIVTIKYVQNGGVVEGSHAPAASRFSLVAEPSVFSSRTALRFCVGNSAAAQVAVYDAEGRCVRTLMDCPKSIGATTVTWDGCDERGMRLAPGAYFVREAQAQAQAQASSKPQLIRKIVLTD